ncbi:hypothetical protein [Candidatus Protochlamydia phocaeensis]|uniref:hypothetical protein n=1 Tax=Candidatus Protochlamydia phocaeensis TaxID=1414722 RepID=UPI0008395512|nr:hypothetical protein [Candidatus Protochlamydia phocaeensis]
MIEAEAMSYLRAYAAQMPGNLVEAILRSGVYSFVISTLLSGKMQTGLLVGTVAASVSVVHALAIPLFRKLSQTNEITWSQHAVFCVINIVLAQAVLSFFIPYRISVFAGTFFTMASSFLRNGCNEEASRTSITYILWG